MVLKLSIRPSASPGRQRSDWSLRVTRNAYFSLLTHTKQLLQGAAYVLVRFSCLKDFKSDPKHIPDPVLVTFCNTPAGIGSSFQTDGQTEVIVEIVSRYL